MASKPMTPQLNGQPWNCAKCGKPIMGSLEWGETAGAFHPECRSQLFARIGPGAWRPGPGPFKRVIDPFKA